GCGPRLVAGCRTPLPGRPRSPPGFAPGIRPGCGAYPAGSGGAAGVPKPVLCAAPRSTASAAGRRIWFALRSFPGSPFQPQNGADTLLHAEILCQALAEVGFPGRFQVVIGALAALAHQLLPGRDVTAIL